MRQSSLFDHEEDGRFQENRNSRTNSSRIVEEPEGCDEDTETDGETECAALGGILDQKRKHGEE